jgi:hypothetical protein
MRKFQAHYVVKHAILLLFILGALISRSNAQADLPIAVVVDSAVHGMWWSADSKDFTFTPSADRLRVDPQFVDSYWYSWSVDTGEVSRSSVWPLQPDIISVLELNSDQANLATISNTFNYVAPNGLLVVINQSQVWQANRSLESTALNATPPRIVETNTFNYDLTRLAGTGPDGFRIQWSEDSSAFAVSARPQLYPDLTFFYYVSRLTDEVLPPLTLSLQPLLSDSREYTIFEVLDLSRDGSFVLLRGRDATVRGPMVILIWNALTNNVAVVPNNSGMHSSTLWAAFKSSDPNVIRMITEIGLIEYNLSSGLTTNLRPDLNSQRFRAGMFSPDGHSVALVETDLSVSVSREYVYVIRLEDS